MDRRRAQATAGRALMAVSVAIGGRLRRGEAATSLSPADPLPGTVGAIRTTHGLTMVAGSTLALWRRGRLPSAVGWLGVGLMAGGLGLRLWSWRVLAEQSQEAPGEEETHAIGAAGPYRYIRHPGYAGALIGWFGYGLALTSIPATLAMTIPNLVVYLQVIAKEEASLADTVGDEYREYQSRTSGLVPGTP